MAVLCLVAVPSWEELQDCRDRKQISEKGHSRRWAQSSALNSQIYMFWSQGTNYSLQFKAYIVSHGIASNFMGWYVSADTIIESATSYSIMPAFSVHLKYAVMPVNSTSVKSLRFLHYKMNLLRMVC